MGKLNREIERGIFSFYPWPKQILWNGCLKVREWIKIKTNFIRKKWFTIHCWRREEKKGERFEEIYCT